MSVKNILEGIKTEGGKIEIADCSRNDLPGFFKEMGFLKGAEIGVYKGEYTIKFLEVGLKMYGIDPWRAYNNYNEYQSLDPKSEYREIGLRKSLSKFQSRQDFLFGHTQRLLQKYLDNGQCELVRKTSMEAIEDFEDESLDFVYIDGHHGFRYVAEDLCEWTPKVKKGGIVSGHDYALNKKGARDPYVLQVKYVLNAFVEAFGVKTLYIVGRTAPEGERTMADPRGQQYADIYKKDGKEEQRDRWRSWFFFKQ
jgi:hypothetical protein